MRKIRLKKFESSSSSLSKKDQMEHPHHKEEQKSIMKSGVDLSQANLASSSKEEVKKDIRVLNLKEEVKSGVNEAGAINLS